MKLYMDRGQLGLEGGGEEGGEKGTRLERRKHARAQEGSRTFAIIF